MTWKDTVKYFYDMGLYDDADVAGFVKNGQITVAEYQEITGKEYVPTDTTKN